MRGRGFQGILGEEEQEEEEEEAEEEGSFARNGTGGRPKPVQESTTSRKERDFLSESRRAKK